MPGIRIQQEVEALKLVTASRSSEKEEQGAHWNWGICCRTLLAGIVIYYDGSMQTLSSFGIFCNAAELSRRANSSRCRCHKLPK